MGLPNSGVADLTGHEANSKILLDNGGLSVIFLGFGAKLNLINSKPELP